MLGSLLLGYPCPDWTARVVLELISAREGFDPIGTVIAVEKRIIANIEGAYWQVGGVEAVGSAMDENR